jgi:hypothetical protein
MRHVFHRILARYLASEQFAFDPAPGELWPEARPTWHPEPARAGSPAPRQRRLPRVYRELEARN